MKIASFFVLQVLILMMGILKKCGCDQIFSADIQFDFATAGMMRQIAIPLMLSSGISQTDLIKLVFPFRLHTSVIPSGESPNINSVGIASDLVLSWQYISNTTATVMGSQKDGIIFSSISTTDSSIYYIRLLDSTLNPLAISSWTWLQITLTLTTVNAMQFQLGGEILPLEMYTVSSSDDSTAIVYDENTILSSFYLFETPSYSIDVSMKFSDPTNSAVLSYIHNIYIDVDLSAIPDEDIGESHFRLSVATDNPKFIFQSSCFSAYRYELPVIKPISQTLFTCSLDSSRNLVVFLIDKSVYTTQKLVRVAVRVANPSVVELSSSIQVFIQREISPRVVGYGIVRSAMATKQITLVDHQVLLAWGIKHDASLPFELKIVRGPAGASSTYQPLNSVKVIFFVQSPTPSVSELIVNVYIKQISSDGYLMTGSIMSNLPAFGTKQVTCNEIDKSDLLNRRIACHGVGQLKTNVQYFVAFKIFVPYDKYEDDILGKNFGSVQIESVEHLTTKQRTLIFTKSPAFINYMLISTNPTLNKIIPVPTTSISTFLTNLQDFPLANVLFRAQDFEDYTDNYVVHSRQFSTTNKDLGFDEFVMPRDIRIFSAYALLRITEIVILEIILQGNTDYYPGSVHSTPLVPLSFPENQEVFHTTNSKNVMWNANTAILSSRKNNQGSTIGLSTTGVLGLRTSPDEQQLVFNTMFTTSTDIISRIPVGILQSNTAIIPDGVGFSIIMNPKILPSPFGAEGYISSYDASLNHKYEHKNVQVSFQRLATDATVNKFTSTQIVFQSGEALTNFLSSIPLQQQWQVRPFVINQFGSNLVDENVFDFYLAVVDKLGGPKRGQIIMSYILVNAFFITDSAFIDPTTTTKTLFMDFSNLFGYGTSAQNNGEFIPSFIKIEGALTATQATSIKRFAVFFNNLQPFYKNKYSNEIDCVADNSKDVNCRGFIETCSDPQNYLTLSRIEIEPLSLTSFMLLIPVLVLPPAGNFIAYLAGMNYPQYLSTLSYNVIGTINAVAGATLITGIPTTSTLNLPYSPFAPIIATFSYQCSTCVIGGVEAITLSGTITSGTISANSPTTKGGSAFTFATDYALFDSSSSVNLPIQCRLYKYTFHSISGANYYLTIRHGVYCTNESFGASVQVLSGFISSIHGGTVIGYGAWSSINGDLAILDRVGQSILTVSVISALTLLPLLPTANTLTQLVAYTFVTPLDIYSYRDGLYFEIAASSAIPYQFPLSDCQLQLTPSSTFYFSTQQSLASLCSLYSVSSTNHIYKIDGIKGYFPAHSSLRLTLIFQPSTGAGSSSANIQIKISTLPSSQYIASSATLAITKSSSLPSVAITALSADNSNIASRTNVNLRLDFNNRFWGENEILAIDFSTFYAANSGRNDLYRCNILEQDYSRSFRFQSISYTMLSAVQISPKVLIQDSPTNFHFFVICYSVLIPASTPTFTATLSGILSPITFTPAAFSSQSTLMTTSPTIVKNYFGIGSNFEMILTVTSNAVSLGGSLPRIVISFPIHYLPRLSQENVITCYVLSPTTEDATCYITDNLKLSISFFRTAIPAGTTVTILIAGITQPLHYYSDYFYIYVDSDNLEQSYDEYFILLDQPITSPLLSHFENYIDVIFQSASSYKFRDIDVTYSFVVHLDASADVDIQPGQALLVNFPAIFEWTFRVELVLSCSLKLINGDDFELISGCSVYGLRVKLYVEEILKSGQSYQLIISGIRNPDGFNPSVKKWTIEVSNVSEAYVANRSFDTCEDFKLSTFTDSTDYSYVNFYDLPLAYGTSQILSSLDLKPGVKSDWIYIRPKNAFASQLWQRSFILTSWHESISIYSEETQITVGTLAETKIRIYSQTAQGEYMFQVSKTGENDFYSQLNILRIRFSALTPVTLNLTPMIYNLYKSLTSFDLLIQMTSLPPASDVSVTFTIPTSPSIGMLFAGSLHTATLTFTENSMYQKLSIIVITASSFTVGSTLTATLTLGGTNAAIYTLAATTFTFNVIANPVPSNTLTLSLDLTAGQTITRNFNYQCTQNSLFFYAVSLQYAEDLTKCVYTQAQIAAYAWDSSTYLNDAVYPCESQFNLVTTPEMIATTSLTLTGLLAEKDYQLQGYCLSMLGVPTTTQLLSFTQSANSGKLYRLRIDFITQPDTAQIIKMLCFLSIHFVRHPNTVSTIDGLTCKEETSNRILFQNDNQNYIEQSNYTQNPIRNLLASSYSSGSCLTANTVTEISGMYSVIFYFDRNEQLSSDAGQSQLITDSITGCFASYANSVITGVPDIINIRLATQILDVAPVGSFNAATSLYIGHTWVFLDDISMNLVYGRVWSILLLATDAAPKARQIVAGQNTIGASALASDSQNFNAINILEYNSTIVGLSPSTSYVFYFVFGNESPFDTIKYSPVYSVAITTLAINYAGSLGGLLEVACVLFTTWLLL